MLTPAPLVTNTRHPMYTLQDYYKFRYTYRGGREFIHRYLKRFDHRETHEDFVTRRELTYNPGFATQALNEIIAGIVQRSPEIIRSGITPSYHQAIHGLNGGVDLQFSTMNSFMASHAIPELLSMGRVGVYVDMPQFNPLDTLAHFATDPHPYFLCYDIFDILNWRWTYDQDQNAMLLASVLLRERQWLLNQAGMPETAVDKFRLCRRLPKEEGGGVMVTFYEQYVTDGGINNERIISEYRLPLNRIPFVMMDIGRSLLTDIADIQIALLNLVSADLNFAINANFPFYIEPYDPVSENIHAKQGPQATKFHPENGNEITMAEWDRWFTQHQAGCANGCDQCSDYRRDRGRYPQEREEAVGSIEPDRIVGTLHGRRYPMEATPPAFIAPSTDPMRASMEKQDSMKQDIRRLLNLNIRDVKTKQSADSKQADAAGSIENGLAFIGLELENAERELGLIWAEYENVDVSDTVQINYPKTWSIKSDADRLTEANALLEVQGAAPSRTFSKEMSKQIARTLLAGKINPSICEKIMEEIDTAKYATGDWQAIQSDFGLGIVDQKTAAEARGYDPALVDQANKERTQRMAEIAKAQQTGTGAAASAARGNPEGAPNAKAEKEDSQQPDKQPGGTKAVRGEGK